MGFPGGSVVKNLPVKQETWIWMNPGLVKSPGDENGNSLQYLCLGNPMDRGAWQAILLGVTKSLTQLSNWAHRQQNWYVKVMVDHRVQNTLGYIDLCEKIKFD